MSWFDLVLSWYSGSLEEVVCILSVVRFREYQNHHEVDREPFKEKNSFTVWLGGWIDHFYKPSRFSFVCQGSAFFFL